MNIVWVGCHEEGVAAFRTVLKNGTKVNAFITLDDASIGKRSAGSHVYQACCEDYGIPYFQVDSIKSDRAYGLVQEACPDLMVVLGWSEILPERLLDIPKIGTVGAHASLLPHNRGSAPVNWALIHGEQTTGNTLFWLDKAVDTGQIIEQREIPVTIYDTCETLYRKVAETNAEMLAGLLASLQRGTVPSSSIRNETDEPLLPRRRPKDGLINWEQSGAKIYDFIRALTKPYPGAFTFLDGRKWLVWSAALLPVSSERNDLRPGEIAGNAYSFSMPANGILVGTEREVLLITSVENDQGILFSGRELNGLGMEGTFGNE